MIEVEISELDMQAERVLDAEWYPCRVSGVDVVPQKKDPSKNNFVVGFEVIGGSDSNGDATGVTTKDSYFSNLGYAFPLFRAVIPGFEPKAGVKLDVSKLKDKQLDVFLKSSEYNGRISMEARSFAPLGTHTNKA